MGQVNFAPRRPRRQLPEPAATLSIAHEGSFERKPGPRGQRRWRAAGLYPAVLLVGNVVISAVKPKVHAHCPLPLHIA